MKRIGLITFHESDNYGTCLQAYALQSALELMGYDVEIINYRRKQLVSNTTPSITERLDYLWKEYGISNLLMRSEVKNYTDNKGKSFSSFRNTYYHYSKRTLCDYSELLELNNQYDAFVCGSDMIWTAERAQNLGVYFLQFANKEKRISYSPSFGASKIPDDLREIYKQYISEIPYLSCREKSGVSLIESLCGKKALLTTDPTLLLDKDFWIDKCAEMHLPPRYVLVYLFEGVPKWVNEAITNVAKILNAEIIEIPMAVRQVCTAIRNKQKIIGPLEFISLFCNASFVFTNSYHGLMFSLIFEKDFYIVPRATEGHWSQFESRLRDILDDMQLTNRILSNNTAYDAYHIHYEEILPILDDRRDSSINYLQKSLYSVCAERDQV